MKKLVVLIICNLFFQVSVNAKYVQTCKIKYKTNFDWSDYYIVDVTFLSGIELNKATKTFDYDSYSIFAVIFLEKDEASVIKISTYTGCGSEVVQNCITNKATNLEGEDQEGRIWEICIKSYCY